jgi:PhnB protein
MELSSYMSFNGQAREAMHFYQSVFGGDLEMNTFAEFGMEGDTAEQIMHASLTLPSGQTLMGSDTPPGMGFSEGARVTLILHGEDEADLRGAWERLIEGGEVTVPLAEQMWGDVYGACVDQYGITWMVNIAQPSA